MPLLKIAPRTSRIKSISQHSKSATLLQTRSLTRKYVTRAQNTPFSTYNEAYHWMCNYFRHPHPDRLVPAMHRLVSVPSSVVLIGSHKQTIDQPRQFHVESLFTYPLVGFLSELLKKHPGMTYEWFRGLVKVSENLKVHPFTEQDKDFNDVIQLSLLIAGTRQGHHVLHAIVKTVLFREYAEKMTGEEKHSAIMTYVKQLAQENPASAYELREEIQKAGKVPERHLASALDSKISSSDIEKEYKELVEKLLKWGASSNARISMNLGRFRATGDVAVVHEMMELFQGTIDKVYTTNNTKLYSFFTTQFRNMLRNFCKYDSNFFGVLIQEQPHIKQSDMRLLIGDLIDEKEGEEEHDYTKKDGKNLKMPRKPTIDEKKKLQEEALARMNRFTQRDFPFIQNNPRKPQMPKQPPRRRITDEDEDEDDDEFDDDDDYEDDRR